MNFFTIFFRNFLSWVEYERNFGVKFCFHFFGLSLPVLAKNNAGKRFYNFLNFFTIFFGIFFPGSSMNGILEWNFVFTFSAYPHRFWIKIMPGRGFKIFWIFLLFFSEFSFPGRVWTEFWSEILLFFWNFLARVEYKWNSGVKFCFHFFGLSPPVLDKNNARKRF